MDRCAVRGYDRRRGEFGRVFGVSRLESRQFFGKPVLIWAVLVC
jgi:hypothetical protein